MESLLHETAHFIERSIEAFAILLITVGAVEAVINIIRVGINLRGNVRARRDVWLNFAHWLVAAMTLQLAADIISTSFEPTMEELIRLGSITLIRTFMSYFLDKEMEARQEPKRPAKD